MTYQEARQAVIIAQDEVVRLNLMLTSKRYQHIIDGTFEGTEEQVIRRCDAAIEVWVKAKEVMNSLKLN